MAARKTRSRSYRIFRLESWDQFLNLVTHPPYSNWAFRGEHDERWPLFSSLSRYLRAFGVHPQAWPEQEQRILRIFKRKAHQFLEQPPDPDDDFEWLALMQHHGAPTRLLDFTWSPYVAAFFALERATRVAAVWALNPAEVSSGSLRRSSPRGRKAIASPAMDPRRPGNLARYFLKGDREFLWLGEPDLM